MATDLKKLREEHEGLAIIVGQLSKMIGEDMPPPARELYQLRMRLASGLIHHLKSEDWMLYPALLASSDDKIALTARAFSASMGGLWDEFKNYSERWGADAINRNWKRYQAETFEILRALTLRMNREERDLYPLLDLPRQTTAHETHNDYHPRVRVAAIPPARPPYRHSWST